MVRSRKFRLLLLLIAIVAGYRLLGVTVVVGIVAFMLYELFLPPPIYRKFPDHMKQAMENAVGIFGRSHAQYEPDPASSVAGRNDPCPCGSGHKYKRCCGRTQ
jgi:SEC-C motif